MNKEELEKFVDNLSVDDYKEMDRLRYKKIDEEISETKLELKRVEYKLTKLSEQKKILAGSVSQRGKVKGKKKEDKSKDNSETKIVRNEDGSQELPL